MFTRVKVESIPENELRIFGEKRVELLATPSGDEINAVVAVPVLEAMMSVEVM